MTVVLVIKPHNLNLFRGQPLVAVSLFNTIINTVTTPVKKALSFYRSSKMAVYKWEPKPAIHDGENDTPGDGRLRVAAYCRVSTDDQESSFIVQQQHFEDLLEKHKDEWVNAGIYADEGISGTGMRKRKAFLRLLRDCDAGKIDMVITKSISRFARNTVDLLNTSRRLSKNGINIYFEKEGMDTSDPANEMIIAFWASFAQAESISIAKNVVAALRVRMERGEGRITNWCSLGYRTTTEKKLEIIPEEAVIVRRIYRMYLEGLSFQKIADRLTEEGIPTPRNCAVWYGTTIENMLENEKYIGDFLFQKTYTIDTLTHAVGINNGEVPQFYSAEHHDPIIPREIFYRVQGERLWRSARRGKYYLSKDLYSRRIICGLCGRRLKKVRFPNGKTEWRCKRRASDRKTDWKENEGICSCRNVSAEMIRGAVFRAVKMIPDSMHDINILLAGEPPAEIVEIRKMIDSIENAEANREKYAERIALYGEKAEYEWTMLHLRNLRELGLRMRGEGERVTDAGEMCSDPEEFYRVTDDMEESAFSDDNSIPENLLRRIFDRVIVYQDSMDVLFLGGIVMEVSDG